MAKITVDVEVLREPNNELKAAYIQLRESLFRIRAKFDPALKMWPGNLAAEWKTEFEQWFTDTSIQVEKLQTLSAMIDHEMSRFQEADMIEEIPGDFLDRPQDQNVVRNWWHNLLRNHGKYSSYAFFLILPSDKAAINYLVDYVDEIDLLSNKNCLALLFGKNRAISSNMDKEAWGKLVYEYVKENFSIKLAEYFEIPFTQFPCMVVFRDIRAQEHVEISLKNMTTDEIIRTMRATFATLMKSASAKEDPIQALRAKRDQENFLKAGKSIISEGRSFAGKTIEAVMEAVVSASIK